MFGGNDGSQGTYGPVGIATAASGSPGGQGAPGPVGVVTSPVSAGQGPAGPAGPQGPPQNIGNTLIVDPVFGNDSTGQRQTFNAFGTIPGALAQAQSGDFIYLTAGIHALSSGIVIPPGVTVRGSSLESTVIFAMVSADTALISLQGAALLEDVEVQLLSQLHVNLTAIQFPAGFSDRPRIRNIRIVVDNSGAGAGSSNVVGVKSELGVSTLFSLDSVRSTNIGVNSVGGGIKRGILIDAPGNLHVRDSVIVVSGTGAGTFIGVETNDPGAVIFISSCLTQGQTADISQTQGAIQPDASFLANNSANGLGFAPITTAVNFVWSDPGGMVTGARFMRFGTSAVTAAESAVTLNANRLVYAMSVRAVAPPGIGKTDTWVLRKNGVDTPMIVSLSGNQTFMELDTISVPFNDSDEISMKQVGAAGSGTTDITVNVSLY